MVNSKINRCGGIIFNSEQNSVLMVLNKLSYQNGENKWGFPKGHKNIGETNVNCARREIYEETGLSIPNEFFTKKLNFYNSLYYIIQIKQDISRFNIKDKNEIVDVKWFNLNSIRKFNFNRDVKEFLNIWPVNIINNNNSDKESIKCKFKNKDFTYSY